MAKSKKATETKAKKKSKASGKPAAKTNTTSPAKSQARTSTTTVAKPKPAQAVVVTTLNHDQIAAKAYEIWLAKGRPMGQDHQNWTEAEAALRDDG